MDQITSLPAADLPSVPAFSPDGRRILFDSLDAKGVDVYEINADGTGLQQLTTDGVSGGGRWSPDEKRIVFARTQPTGLNVVLTMRSSGGGEQKVLTTVFWDSIAAGYTPDGRQIVFYTEKGGLVSAVWIMTADGSDQKRLTTARPEDFPFDVSPDGQQILMMDHQNTALPTGIYTMQIGGSHVKRLTQPDNVHEVPGSYSPDGKKIVFFSDRLNAEFTYDLFTMNADGSDIKRIASNVGTCPYGNCVNPTWGPKPR